MMRSRTNCFVAVLLLGGCTSSSTPAPAAIPPLVGAWENRLQFTTGPYVPVKDLRFVYSFNLGGTMTESSNYDAVPPVAPAYGVWRQVGPAKFEARYVFYQTKPPASLKEITSGMGWLPLSRGVITERISVAADGNSFESSLTIEAFDMADKPTTGGGEATGHGTRISF